MYDPMMNNSTSSRLFSPYLDDVEENLTLEELEILAEDSGDPLYKVPPVGVVILSLFYGAITLVAIVGNTLVFWIVSTSRRVRNTTNYFIANLALADVIIAMFVIPFQFQAALLQRWNLPYFMCFFCPFIQCLSVNVSVFTLTAIAIDRYRAICNPLSHRPGKYVARVAIGSIWVLGFLIAFPLLFSHRVTLIEDHEQPGERKPYCSPTLHGHYPWITNYINEYTYFTVAFQYFIPLLLISYAYTRMGIKLWGSEMPGNAQGSRDAIILKNKVKVIKMLIIVVATFAVCWLPLQTYKIVMGIYPQVNGYPYINIIFFAMDWLAMSNSCYNPFIYAIYNHEFRTELRDQCNRCRGRETRPVEEQTEQFSLQTMMGASDVDPAAHASGT